MSQVFSEISKVVNVSGPANHASATGFTTDIVNMENYKKCTFILASGASATNTPKITVYSGVSDSSSTTAIPFKYRTQVKASDAVNASGDVPSALTDATTTGFEITTQKTGGVYIIEVDAAGVAAGTTAGAATNYDHVALTITDGSASATQYYGIIAVLSEPRYPQAILQTAID